MRVFLIIMDSVGVGASVDANKYGDEGADTLGNIAKNKHLNIPNLINLGIANLHPLKGIEPVSKPLAYYTKLSEASVGKDTMTGHWEMMGLYIDTPFITFTDTGFPDELIKTLEDQTGHKIIGNKAASGTEIIEELGAEHQRTNAMIVYTSADSVLQIAAHEETFGLDELYRCCKIARELTMQERWRLGRIIARPFIGKLGSYKRTSNRHDYALKPSGKTVLDTLKSNQYSVISVGKINDIFDTEGITEAYKSKSNEDGMNITIKLLEKDFSGLCFVNLVDFDALWGHRRDIEGYARELEHFDTQLGTFLNKMNEDDILIISADHGNDPSFKGSDHTREQIPVLVYSKKYISYGLLPSGNTFADIGATIADLFEVKLPKYGLSFKQYLK